MSAESDHEVQCRLTVHFTPRAAHRKEVGLITSGSSRLPCYLFHRGHWKRLRLALDLSNHTTLPFREIQFFVLSKQEGDL
jgi:hypothetical protein